MNKAAYPSSFYSMAGCIVMDQLRKGLFFLDGDCAQYDAASVDGRANSHQLVVL